MHLKTLTVLSASRMFTEGRERSWLFTELPHSRKICDYLSGLTVPCVQRMCFLSIQKRRPSSVSHEVLCGRENQSQPNHCPAGKRLTWPVGEWVKKHQLHENSLYLFIAEIRGLRTHGWIRSQSTMYECECLLSASSALGPRDLGKKWTQQGPSPYWSLQVSKWGRW